MSQFKENKQFYVIKRIHPSPVLYYSYKLEKFQFQMTLLFGKWEQKGKCTYSVRTIIGLLVVHKIEKNIVCWKTWCIRKIQTAKKWIEDHCLKKNSKFNLTITARLDLFQNFKKSGLIKSHGPQLYLLKEVQEAEKCLNILFSFTYFFTITSYSILPKDVKTPTHILGFLSNFSLISTSRTDKNPSFAWSPFLNVLGS